jgi:pantetheine-phosphate adenylyltransferase
MYSTIFVGGTFDKLHAGHIALLSRAFAEGEQVTIGLTSDTYIQKFKKGQYGSYGEREAGLVSWLTGNGFLARSVIVPIENPYEPASTGAYASLIVTPANRLRGEEINSIRTGRGLVPLSLIEVPLVNAEDGKPISSTRVRSGEIDKSGHLYLPEIIRANLHEPLGKVLAKGEIAGAVNAASRLVTVAVGDMTVTNVMKLGLVPTLSVIDLKIRRQTYQSFADYRFPETATIIRITSGPGFISGEAVDAVKNWAESLDPDRNTVMIVEGEEDLLTLPAVIYAPIGSIVFYGQPELPDEDGRKYASQGLVEVVVSQQAKEKALELIAKFEKTK